MWETGTWFGISNSLTTTIWKNSSKKTVCEPSDLKRMTHADESFTISLVGLRGIKISTQGTLRPNCWPSQQWQLPFVILGKESQNLSMKKSEKSVAAAHKWSRSRKDEVVTQAKPGSFRAFPVSIPMLSGTGAQSSTTRGENTLRWCEHLGDLSKLWFPKTELVSSVWLYVAGQALTTPPPTPPGSY